MPRFKNGLFVLDCDTEMTFDRSDEDRGRWRFNRGLSGTRVALSETASPVNSTLYWLNSSPMDVNKSFRRSGYSRCFTNHSDALL